MGDPFRLPQRLDAATAPSLAQALQIRAATDDLNLDATETVHIGAMGAQVLLSACVTAHATKNRFHIAHLDDRVRAQLKLMGLAHDLKLEEMT